MRAVVVLVVVLLEMMTVVGPSAAATPSDKLNRPAPAVATTLAAAGVTPAPKITVLAGTPVVDQATITGFRARARGRIAYLVFSDPNCQTLVFDATPAPNRVRRGVVPASRAFSSASAGIFYWVAVFTRGKGNNENEDNDRDSDEDNAQVGDEDNDDDDNDAQVVAKSPCGDEQLTVVEPAHLLVKKHVVNDNGGVKTAADFRITVTGGDPSPPSFDGNESGTTVTFRTLASVTYSVDEAAIDGYAKNLSTGCAGTIAANESKTCIITNDDIAAPSAPRLTVIKHVVNDNGGLAKAAEWQMTITNNGAASAPFAGTEAGTTRELSPGSYSVAESGGPAGYTATLSASCSGTIAAGEGRTCTITNDDQPAHLTVIKQVINDNGGTKQANDFQITVTGTAPSPTTFPGSLAGTDVTLGAGAYSVDEAAVTGYTKTGAVGCTGTVALGETKTCTLTNDDIAPPSPQLTVVKHVVNDNGGTQTAADFTLTITNNGTALPSFAGSETGTTRTLSAGSYSVAEASVAGYAATLSADCSGTIAAGESRTCTITNNDIAPQVTVIKHVINDNGGNKAAADFTLTITSNGTALPSFAGSETGTTRTLTAGSYSVGETSMAGYAGTMSADCSGTVAAGQAKTCTITNDDQPAHLTVIKHVVNDNGGNLTAPVFVITVTNNGTALPAITGSEVGTVLTLNAGTYSVAEASVAGYAATMAAGCGGTLALADTKTCTITNDDIAPRLIVVKHVLNNNGGSKVAGDFTITVTNNGSLLPSFPGNEAGVTVTLALGSYSVDEISVAGYAKRFEGLGCSGTIALGETKTCNITNDDIAGTVLVVKHVINDNGGTSVAGDFQMIVTNNGVQLPSFPGNEGGTSRLLNAGTYAVTENSPLGYTASLSASCSGTIALGETNTCTITNDDIPPAAPQLTVVKHVINDNGGSKAAADFTITITNDATALPSFAGSETGVTRTLTAGSYSVAEGSVAGYAATLSADCSGTIAAGDARTCTITNNDIAPVLTVIKHVINDNGGTKTAADFTITVTSNGTALAPFAGAEAPGTAVTLTAGTYSVAEGSVAGYAGTMSADCAGSIAIGQSKTCTITNDDQRAQLTVVKHVINDSGGNALASSWTMNVTGSAPSLASFPGSESGTTITIGAGSYSVDETGGPSGYTKGLSATCSGTIAAGESKTCTITNDDQPAHLTVVKHVVNDNGGARLAGGFTITVTGAAVSTPTFPGAESPGTAVTLNAGPYSVDETAVAGYAKTLGAGCSGILALAESRTCTITNDDIAPRLTVTKNVGNDNGGTKVAGDFTITVTGTNVSLPTFPGSAAGTQVTFNAGAYSVDETAVAGYAKTLGLGCSGTLAVGDTQACTITNDDIGPVLTVIKHVINDNGGTKAAADFSIVVTNNGTARAPFAGAEQPGTGVTLNVGAYSVDEAAVAGYAKTLSAGCSGTLALAATASCTITNDDLATPPAPQLTVVKHVVNNNGGTNAAADFTITITNNGTALPSFAGSETGITRTLAAGSYSVTEATVTGYAASLSTDCTGTLAGGDTKTCTITNDDVGPVLTVIKHVVNDNGGTRAAADFTIAVTNNGTALPSFAGSETGTLQTLSAGAYSVAEASVAGYVGSLSADCTGTIAAGESKICTITNDDQPTGLLIVRNIVVNDNGGTAVPSDLIFSVMGTSPSPDVFPGSSTGTTVTIGTGPYRVDVNVLLPNYAMSFSADCRGTMGPGETKACTFTSDDIAPRVVVVKRVVNDNGRTKTAGDFTITVTGNSPNPATFPGNGGQSVTLSVGSYSVDEAPVADYTKTLSGGCSGTLGLGGFAQCFITNDDIAGSAQLTVIKHVINDNGGTKTAANFTMTVTGTSPSPASFPGSETGTLVGITSGAYAVDELPVSGYHKTLGPDCFGTIAPGGAKTCTITNDDIAVGTTFTVNSFLDGADDAINGTCFSTVGQGCTLRAAIQEANAHAGPDTVVLLAGTYTLTIKGAGELAGATGDLNITDDLAILGAGSSSTTVAGGAGFDDRLFHSGLSIQDVSISGVTLTGGNADGNGGGAFFGDAFVGHLFLSDVKVQGNTSVGPGGGIRFSSGGDLTATDLVLSSNTSGGTFPGPGGGLDAVVNVVHLDRITVTGNTSIGGDGGMRLRATVGTVDHLSVTNNETTSGGQGGASVIGQVAVRNATIALNRAPSVGGIVLVSGASLSDSLVDSNQAVSYGGIALQSSGGLERVRITNNSVTGSVSGLYINGSTGEHLTDVTISGNAVPSATGPSAAIFLNNFGDSSVLTNVTISGNQDRGIADFGSNGMRLTNVTISGNRDSAIGEGSTSPELLTNVTIASNGFGIVLSRSGLSARNVIVANNTGGNWSCGFGEAFPTSLGHNLDSGTAVGGCGFGGGPGDQTNTDPLLGPLANNGGFTQTHALLPGSPAIDRGDPDPATCPATDQRGIIRPRDGDGVPPAVCDIGAFERQSLAVP